MIILLSGGLNNQLALSYFNNGSIIEVINNYEYFTDYNKYIELLSKN